MWLHLKETNIVLLLPVPFAIPYVRIVNGNGWTAGPSFIHSSLLLECGNGACRRPNHHVCVWTSAGKDDPPCFGKGDRAKNGINDDDTVQWRQMGSDEQRQGRY